MKNDLFPWMTDEDTIEDPENHIVDPDGEITINEIPDIDQDECWDEEVQEAGDPTEDAEAALLYDSIISPEDNDDLEELLRS